MLRLVPRYVLVIRPLGTELVPHTKCLVQPCASSASSSIAIRHRSHAAGLAYDEGGGGRRNQVVSVPIRLEKRLEQKVIRDRTKSAIKRRIVEASRKGSTTVVITSKRSDLNHYHGQSYSSNEELPLVSKGWAHRKAGTAHDFFKIHAHGNNIALPDLEDKTTFLDLGLKSNIVELLEQNGIRQPTLIQAAAIPKLLKGLNCLISAETGCGKTLAYLLPLFQQILNAKRLRNYSETVNAPSGLILVPTRELAQQIANVAETLGKEFGINVKLVQGGNIGSKIKNPPSHQIDIMVSTVNVISELTRVEVYSMQNLKTLILDEADTLTDDSFCDEVLEFIKPLYFIGTSSTRVQIALVSATMPLSVDTVLSEKLDFTNFVPVTTPGLHMIMRHVPQTFLRLKKLEKPVKLVELLKKDIANKISTIVFCNRHETCTWVSDYLEQNEIGCFPLNSGILPRHRKGHLKSYLSQDVPVLVATDIGSRGIDTIQTGHVINYDFPSFIADYVHRCGRTGRVGSKVQGRVTSLISWPNEAILVQQIEKAVRKETSLHRVDANIKKHLNAKYGYGMNKSILPIERNSDNDPFPS